MVVRGRVLVEALGMDGPKKRDAELPLVSRLTGAQASRVDGLCNEFGPLLPVSRRCGIEEPRMGEAAVETTENRLREAEGNATGGAFGGAILNEWV